MGLNTGWSTPKDGGCPSITRGRAVTPRPRPFGSPSAPLGHWTTLAASDRM